MLVDKQVDGEYSKFCQYAGLNVSLWKFVEIHQVLKFCGPTESDRALQTEKKILICTWVYPSYKLKNNHSELWPRKKIILVSMFYCKIIKKKFFSRFIGYVILLVFESTEFCNKYIFSEPQTEGLITLAGFLKFWGIVFLITTVLLAIFKKEHSELEKELEEHPDYGVTKAYPILWKIIKLKPVLKVTLMLLTVKASFAACDVVSSLKFIEYGVPKDKIALLAIPLVPIQLVLPFIISRYTAGPNPMNFFFKAFPYRLFMTIVIAVFVYYTPKMKTDDGFPFYFYVAIVCIYMVYQVELFFHEIFFVVHFPLEMTLVGTLCPSVCYHFLKKNSKHLLTSPA